jgi:hypothetical protein
MAFALYATMRIELQLVEFERGACAVIPVAAAAARPALINHLVISRFAHLGSTGTRGSIGICQYTRQQTAQEPLCHNDTTPLPQDGQNAPAAVSRFPIPITFAAPVAFTVPVELDQ